MCDAVAGSMLVGLHRSQVLDHRSVGTLRALNELPRARTQLNYGVIGREVNNPPVRAEERPTLQAIDCQGFGGHRGPIITARQMKLAGLRRLQASVGRWAVRCARDRSGHPDRAQGRPSSVANVPR